MISACWHKGWTLVTSSDCPVIVISKPMHGGVGFATFDRPRDLLLMNPEHEPAVKFTAGTPINYAHEQGHGDRLMMIQRSR